MPRMSAEQALQELLAGNQRYLQNVPEHPNQSEEQRNLLLERQQPFANVLCCADSRVVPSILFDQGLGDLFVMRVAGNIVDEGVLASLEFAIEVLRVPLTIVLGHSRCGAIRAAMQPDAESPLQASPHIEHLVKPIRQSAQRVADPSDLEAVGRAHAVAMAETISHAEPIIAAQVQTGQHRVLAGCYDLAKGKVELLSSWR